MEDAPEWILVGSVVGPHGIRGELKVRVETDRPERFAAGSRLFLKASGSEDFRSIRVEEGKPNPKGAIVRLEGFATREQAEAVAGDEFYISREQLLPPGEGYYYGFQIEGCEVFEGGRRIGIVRRFMEGKANPYLEIDPGNGSRDILVPFVGEVILEVDLSQRRILIPEGFLGEAPG